MDNKRRGKTQPGYEDRLAARLKEGFSQEQVDEDRSLALRIFKGFHLGQLDPDGYEVVQAMIADSKTEGGDEVASMEEMLVGIIDEVEHMSPQERLMIDMQLRAAEKNPAKAPLSEGPEL